MPAPQYFIRVTHSGVYPDGRPNTSSVQIPDMDTGSEYQTRKAPSYVPAGGYVDIPATSRALYSYLQGGIASLVEVGLVEAELNLGPPTGTVELYAGATAPTGYLLCNGAAVSRTTYAALFEILGTTYGAGDGTTTFNLPDLRGRAPIGVGTGTGLTARALAATGGAETVTLDTTQIPGHTHTGTTASSGAHTHTHNAPGGQGNLGLAIADGTNTSDSTDPSAGELNVWTTPRALVIDSAGAHTHTFTSDSTGGGQAHANMQPFLALNFIVKT